MTDSVPKIHQETWPWPTKKVLIVQKEATIKILWEWYLRYCKPKDRNDIVVFLGYFYIIFLQIQHFNNKLIRTNHIKTIRMQFFIYPISFLLPLIFPKQTSPLGYSFTPQVKQPLKLPPCHHLPLHTNNHFF